MMEDELATRLLVGAAVPPIVTIYLTFPLFSAVYTFSKIVLFGQKLSIMGADLRLVVFEVP